MQNLIIRKMTIDDYDNLYALWMSCKGMGLNDVDDSREGIEAFLKRNPTTCLVAEKNEKMVGAIMVGTDGRRAYIYHTAVSTDCRREGIGKALVDSAIIEIEKCGIKKVALVVFARNELGNSFWESQGFSKRVDINYRNKQLKEMVRFDT